MPAASRATRATPPKVTRQWLAEVDSEAVEPVGDRRARRAAALVLRSEHEVVDEQLRAPPEEVGQHGAPFVGRESVLLVDPDPRQLLASPRQLVAAPRQLFLRLEQSELCGQPLFPVSRSGVSSSFTLRWLLFFVVSNRRPYDRVAGDRERFNDPASNRGSATSVAGFRDAPGEPPSVRSDDGSGHVVPNPLA